MLANWKTYALGALFWVWVLVAIAVSSCRVPPTGTVRKVIDCTSDVVQQNWPGAIGPVNTCLTGAGATACLLGLIKPAVGITEDVIACVVRREGSDFAAAATINREDVRSWRAAENARRFIVDRGYEFTDDK